MRVRILTRIDRVPKRNVSGNTFVKALLDEHAEGGGQMLQLISALVELAGEGRGRADDDAAVLVAEEMDIFLEGGLFVCLLVFLVLPGFSFNPDGFRSSGGGRRRCSGHDERLSVGRQYQQY